MILFYQLADIANESLQGSPLYEIMWRGWMEDCKSIITNRRPFLSAGWLLTGSWQTCSNEADAAMYSPVPANGKGIGE